MEDNPRIPMAKTGNIIRRSIYTFLRNYHYFTLTSAILAFPFSISILLSQALLVPHSATLLSTLYTRLKSLSRAAGFPSSCEFFSILNLKLSQTICSSILTLPLTLTFFLFAKASVIHALEAQKPILTLPSFSSITSIFSPLLITYICNIFLIISANATAFCILFLSFNCLEGFGFASPTNFLVLSAAGAVLYSLILANALIICNLSLVSSGMERSGGYLSILKAFVMVQGKTSIALSLALPVNLALAGIEALFQYRVAKAYHKGQTPTSVMILEGLLIAYLYSFFLVLETIASFIFYKCCKASSCINQEGSKYAYRIGFVEEEKVGFVSIKVSQ